MANAWVAANNRNDIFYKYLQTGVYSPRPSVATIANAMDVGAPSNFARVLDLYGNSHDAICADISGATYRALSEGLKPGETGIFLETAHPAKFKDTVEKIIGEEVDIPAKLQAFMRDEKKSVAMSKEFTAFKNYLMNE